VQTTTPLRCTLYGWKLALRKRKIFYGWVIVAVSFITMLFAYGIWYSFSLFYLPILEEFGWNRANTVIIFSISSVTYGLGSFVAGALFDRFGPRISFSVAATIMALGLLGCSQASAIWQFCLFFGVLTAFGVAAMGFVPVNALVSNWFIKRRATVVGIAQAGGRETSA
jgi:MFS family permease